MNERRHRTYLWSDMFDSLKGSKVAKQATLKLKLAAESLSIEQSALESLNHEASNHQGVWFNPLMKDFPFAGKGD